MGGKAFALFVAFVTAGAVAVLYYSMAIATALG